MIPTYWCACPCVIPLPGVWDAPSDSLLAIEHGKVIGFSDRIFWDSERAVTSVLLSFSPCPFGSSWLYCLNATNFCGMRCSVKRFMWQGPEGGLQPTALQELRPRSSRPQGTGSCQLLCEQARKWIMSNWVLTWPQLQPRHRWQSCKRLTAKGLLNCMCA